MVAILAQLEEMPAVTRCQIIGSDFRHGQTKPSILAGVGEIVPDFPGKDKTLTCPVTGHRNHRIGQFALQLPPRYSEDEDLWVDSLSIEATMEIEQLFTGI